ncbi:hypothetical protein CS542_03575 [Pedobacter sp. IW39]|nr:hypothetical protein CS542_03575 [Pedobacter sp. IW39]
MVYLTAAPEAARLSAGFETTEDVYTYGRWLRDRSLKGLKTYTEGQAGYTNDGVNIMTSEGATVRAVFGGKCYLNGNTGDLCS